MPFKVASRHTEIAWILSARCNPDRVEIALQLHIAADVRIHSKLHAFGFHLPDAAVDGMLFHLEIRNAVAKQTAHPVGFT
jgi:hypothetical protein